MNDDNPLHLGLEFSEDGKMKRSDYWRLRYRIHPYLCYLTEQELRQRWHDTFTNLSILTAKGQIGVNFKAEEGEHAWGELWVDVMEEFGRRGQGIPSDIIRPAARVLKTRFPRESKGVQELRRLPWEATNALVRFGSKAWLRETFKSGRWRIAPATSYSSRVLSAARRDDEMLFEAKFPVFSSPEDKPFQNRSVPDKLDAVLNIVARASSDYYLSCLSRRMVYRMFDDFEADSFIVVRDEKAFQWKMTRAFNVAKPGWKFRYGPVTYVDPFFVQQLGDIQFLKDFKYSYQEEYRFAWIRLKGGPDLEPFFLDLGPLDDCCDYLELDS